MHSLSDSHVVYIMAKARCDKKKALVLSIDLSEPSGRICGRKNAWSYFQLHLHAVLDPKHLTPVISLVPLSLPAYDQFS